MGVRGEARDRLLAAAVALFAERGYDRTTTRDIAQRADVDPTLITRYFGGKANLFLAALEAESAEDPAPDPLRTDRLRGILEAIDDRGPGLVLRGLVHEHEDAAVQEAAREVLRTRLVDPLRRRFTERGASHPQLLAEVAVAAFAGVALGRASGMLTELSAVPTDVLATLVDALVDALPDPSGRPTLSPGPERGRRAGR